MHFLGVSIEQKKGQWYLNTIKRDEHLDAAIFGVVPPGDLKADELNEALLPLPVKETTESVTKDGKHYYLGSLNFEKQYDNIQPQSALISPHRKQIQEFLADTPEDDNDIIEIKESPDVQDYIRIRTKRTSVR